MPRIEHCIMPACGQPPVSHGRCEAHRIDAQREYERLYHDSPYRAVYQSKAWKIVRTMALARDHHTCLLCGQPATDVDHIIPLAEGGAAYDLTNLQSLCREDHGRKTREEIERRKGKANGLPT